MQNASAIIGLFGTVLIIIVPLLMLGCLLFLYGSRSKGVVSEEGRKLGFGMVISHFVGFALFVAANAISVQLQPVRILAACIAIFLFGVVPSAIGTLLIKRRLIPPTLYPLGWSVAVATGLLSLVLVFVVRMADLAVRAASH